MIRLVCMPCEKGNHRWCMGEVMDVANSNMVPCECIPCGGVQEEQEQIRAEQTYREDQQKW